MGAEESDRIKFRPFHFVINPNVPTKGDLWVQAYQRGETSFEAQQLMINIDLANVRFRTNGPDISVIDARAFAGPIFAPDYPAQSYVRLEYGSDEMLRRYGQQYFTGCFAGTLVATPRALVQERVRGCGS